MSIEYVNSPLLDARLWGSPLFTAPANQETEFNFEIPFDCKWNGIEIFAWGPNKGDHMKLQTEYNAGPYGWKRYKKFGKHFNIYPNYVNKIILFPSEPKAGVRVCVYYTNTGNTPVDFSINLYTFVDEQVVNTNNLEEGEDW